MTATLRRSAALTLTLLLAAALFAGCGSDNTLSKDEVAKEAQAQFDKIAKDRGQSSFPKITCPSDLKAKKGATTRCKAVGTDGTLGITVTVDSVDGGKAKLHFQADNKLQK